MTLRLGKRVLGLAGGFPAALRHTGVAAAEAEEPASENREIVVQGSRYEIAIDIPVKDELNVADIAAYGVDTIRDLLDAFGADLGDADEGPVVLTNGKLATGVDEITDLPAETAARVQLLPRGAGSSQATNMPFNATFQGRPGTMPYHC